MRTKRILSFLLIFAVALGALTSAVYANEEFDPPDPGEPE